MLVTVMQIYEYNYNLCNKYQRIYLLFFCLKILSRAFVVKKLMELSAWICRVFIIFLLHSVWVTEWNVLTL